MARPTSPTILPDHASLHLVRLEADEQFILAVVATTSSEASLSALPVPFPEHPLALHSPGG